MKKDHTLESAVMQRGSNSFNGATQEPPAGMETSVTGTIKSCIFFYGNARTDRCALLFKELGQYFHTHNNQPQLLACRFISISPVCFRSSVARGSRTELLPSTDWMLKSLPPLCDCWTGQNFSFHRLVFYFASIRQPDRAACFYLRDRKPIQPSGSFVSKLY